VGIKKIAERKETIMAENEVIQQLSPYLFWDMDKSKLDLDKHSAHLISRVLEHGQLKDWRIIRDYYGMDRVVSDCKRLRTLDPMALSFICTISNTNKEDYRCYHFAPQYITCHKSTWRKTGDVVFDNEKLIDY